MKSFWAAMALCLALAACATARSSALDTLDHVDYVSAKALAGIAALCTGAQMAIVNSDEDVVLKKAAVQTVRSKCDPVYVTFLDAANAHDFAVDILESGGTIDKVTAAVADAESKLSAATQAANTLRKALAP